MELQKQLTIGALAKSAGVTVETVRFYQRKRLLREPAKPYGGIRHYEPVDVARLRFIKSAQRLGFSLDEVADLLRLDDGLNCEAASYLAAQKREDVQSRIRELSRMDGLLGSLVDACRANRGKVPCPLIQSLKQY